MRWLDGITNSMDVNLSELWVRWLEADTLALDPVAEPHHFVEDRWATCSGGRVSRTRFLVTKCFSHTGGHLAALGSGVGTWHLICQQPLPSTCCVLAVSSRQKG